jgi:FtsP/CotA-like multicopper oxidase with cupredoxin domain
MKKRRDFLKLSLVTATYLLVGCEDRLKHGINDNITTNKSGLIINAPLSIPPLIDPELDVNGVKQYNLSIQKSTHNFYKDSLTNTFGINQSYLGNTLLVKRDDKVSINYTNKLDEATTIHGHGMHVPASQDGGVHQRIEVGSTWSAKYTVNQRACTNWYHPHLMGKTAEHVYHGLAGLIIVEDDESKNLALPKKYGVNDIPLIVQDRTFVNFQLDYNPDRRDIMMGYRGDVLLINGQVEPILKVKADTIRLRILNGSNASMYKFYFEDNRIFQQIATDNSFLEAPVSLISLTLSPSERAEIIVDLSSEAGKKLILKTKELINDTLYTALNIEVEIDTVGEIFLLTSLITHEDIDVKNVLRTRTFTLEGSGNRGNPILTINNKEMDMARIDETLTLDELEIWKITNTMNMNHNFHIHATHFKPYKRYNSNNEEYAIASNEKGYKDCIHIPPLESVEILVKMIDYSDKDGKYMYHCHFLEHEDAGMMGQFVVV